MQGRLEWMNSVLMVFSDYPILQTVLDYEWKIDFENFLAHCSSYVDSGFRLTPLLIHLCSRTCVIKG